jgi:hypothetical protein
VEETIVRYFQDFVDLCCEQVGLPEADVRRCLTLHLEAADITEHDIEVYINYPAMTEAELAEAFDASESAIGRTLARVRKAWPSLMTDPECRQNGTPSLPAMLPYAEWMDEVTIQKF